MKIINIDVKDEIILKNIEDVDTNEITGISSRVYVPTGNYNNIILNFNFNNTKLCEDMDMFANFSIVDGACVDVALEKITVKDKVCQYACFIPAEVFVDECDFFLGLFGYSLNEDGSLKQRVSFVSVKNSVIKGTYDPEATEGTLPSPSVFEVYFQQVKEINEQIENEYQGIIDRLNEIKDEHIEDFNEKIEPEKQNAINDINTQADAKLEEVKEDIDEHFEQNASSYRKDINSNTFRIKRLETDIFDSGEASGTSINIKDSTLSEFQELAVDGTHEQVTTNGENLFNANVCISHCSVDKDTITITADTTDVYLQGAFVYNENNKFMTLETGNYYIKSTNSNVRVTMYSDGVQLDTAGIQPNVLSSICNFGGIRVISVDGSSLKNVSFEIKISKDKMTDEPYTGEQESPSPPYPQEIEVIEEDFEVKSTGKNILSIDMFRDGIVPALSTGLDVNSGGMSSTSFIEIDNTLPLYLTLENGNATQYVFLYDKDYNFIKFNSGNENSYVHEIYKDSNYAKTKYIKIRIDDKKETIEKAQLEYNKVATEYEPYQETKVTFEIPEGEFFGSVSDTITDEAKIVFNEEDGQYHKIIKKNVVKQVFTGDENWRISSTYSTIELTISDKYVRYGMDGLMCSHFHLRTGTSTDKYVGIDNNSNAIRIWGTNMTEEEFKAFAKEEYDKGTPVTLVYELAEPYTLDLGVVDMPLSYYPVTNVFTNHNLQPVINVKYYRDIKNTITTMQTDIEALKQAVSTLTTNQTNLSSEVDLLQEQVFESEVVE